MVARRFGFTRDFSRKWNNSAYFRPRKILCDKSAWSGFWPCSDPEGVEYMDVFHQFKDQAKTRHPGEECGFATDW